MRKQFVFVGLALLLALALGLSACGKQAPTQAPAAPSQAQPATSMGYDEALDKAMDAAKAGDAESAKTALQAALQAAKNDADKAFVNELLEDVDKGDLGEVAEDIERYLQQQQSGALPADEVARAKQLYIQLGCFACHGANYEGNQGPIIVGMPVDEIIHQVRNGAPNPQDMPAFDQTMISDADLEILAKFLNSLTIADTAVVIPDEVRTHLEKAYDALTAGDKAGVETHLKTALKAAQDAGAGEGLIKTLDDLTEDLEEETWQKDIELHLDILLGK